MLVLACGNEAAEIGSCLRADGAVPTVVAGVDGAVAALADPGSRFDLAILCMPAAGTEHLRLASRLKAQHATRDLPVLLVADPAQRDLVLRGFEIGASDYVLRPTDGNELRARVRNQIRRRRYEERLRTDLDRSLELAVSDPLTGLRNRRFVQHHLEAALKSGDVPVMMIDVDRFKSINDGHGHAGGDTVLREVAERLRSQLRAADVVARYGGEEFLVVLADAPPEEAVAIAERLRAALERTPIATGNGEASVTVSIGLAITPAGVSAAEAVAAADVALYRAKALGRNRVEVGEPPRAAAALGSAAGSRLNGRTPGRRRAGLLDLGFAEDDVLAHDRVVLLHLELAGGVPDVLLRDVEVARFRAADQLDLDGVRLGHGDVFR